MHRVLTIVLAISIAMAASLAGCATSASTASRALAHMRAQDCFEGAPQVGLVSAIERADSAAAAAAVKQGADPNQMGREGVTPLLWAMGKNTPSGVRIALEVGADPNLIARWTPRDASPRHQSAMELAAMYESPEILQILLENGGNPNLVTTDQTKQTPIFNAILHERARNIELLLMSGADINHRDLAMATPIEYAVTSTSYSMALLLLRKGADPTIKDRWGRNAVDITKEFGDRGVPRGSADQRAYPEFVSELKGRGLW